MRKKIFLELITWSMAFVLLMPSTAYAYLDAGTGSQIIQILIATSMGLLLVVRNSYGRIKMFIKNIREKRKQPINISE